MPHMNFLVLRLFLFLQIFFCSLISGVLSINEKFMQVNILNGSLRGFQLNLNSKKSSVKSIDLFLGIPYAEPPIGKLRLEKPQPSKKWSGIRDATKLGLPCVPVHFLGAPNYSEDCLFLNVFRPSKPKNGAKHPVLVFIHGGGFNLGGNFVEGYENISQNFVTQNFVVVTLQYRLGFFGFFSDGSKNFPGNYGLWDQRQALLWIKENIAAFGGDPHHVTVWGQSAGSASVSMLSISKHSRDLFEQAIEQSGSVLSRWALNEETVKFSKSLIKEFGCSLNRESTNDNDYKNEKEDDDDDDSFENLKNKSLKQCLKDISVEDVLYTLGNHDLIRGEFEIVVFNPRFDDDFFDSDIKTAINESPKKPTLLGFNSHEASFLTLNYAGSIYGLRGPMTLEEYDTFGKLNLTQFINKAVHLTLDFADLTKEKSELKSVQNVIQEFYIEKNTKQKKDYHFYIKQYTTLVSDVMFIIPSLWEARFKMNSGWPVYLYQFNYANSNMFTDLPFNPINHGTEYPYLQGVHIFRNFELNNKDHAMRQFMIEFYSNFIKTGNPSTVKLNWPKALSLSNNTKTLSYNKRLRCLRIQSTDSKVKYLAKSVSKRLSFWDNLNATYEFSHLSGFPTLFRH